MVWELAVCSDIGGRIEQQDRVDVISTADGRAHLVALADGMGGHADGAMAAQTVLDTAKRCFGTSRLDDPQRLLQEIISAAHVTITELGQGGASSPGSTCALLLICDAEAYWAHVGDSRVYQMRGPEVVAKTRDHSLVELMIAQGKLEENDAIIDGMRNQLYMRLGGGETPDPGFSAAEVEPDDFFLLCSDGFWELVLPEQVATVLATCPIEESANRLVALARERGGEDSDNISLALARWQAPVQGRAGMVGRLRGWFGN